MPSRSLIPPSWWPRAGAIGAARRALDARGDAYARASKFDDADLRMRRCVALREQGGDRLDLATSLMNWANMLASARI